jgi:hypothetical protein
MIKIDDSGTWRKDVGKEIRRLEILLFDMNSLYSAGGYPPPEELARAPELVGVERDTWPAACLVGTRIKDGRASVVKTSRIEMMGIGWVRTKNSLYRLEVGHG